MHSLTSVNLLINFTADKIFPLFPDSKDNLCSLVPGMVLRHGCSNTFAYDKSIKRL